MRRHTIESLVLLAALVPFAAFGGDDAELEQVRNKITTMFESAAPA